MTSGNPLLLRQLLRALEDEGIPPDVSHVDTVRAVGSRAVSALATLRLRRMSPAVTAAARAVAVLGDAAGLATVASLAQLPEDQVATALDTLSRSEILTDGHPPTFVHPLIGDGVYDDMPSSERALHHERAASLLQHQGAAPEQVAAHLLRAPRRGSAATVELLRVAARTARARGASESAVVLLRRALEEPVGAPERTALLLELGLAETLVDGPASAAHLSEAYAVLDDDRERARIAMVIARTHVFVSPPGVATDFARRAAAAVPAGLDDERQGLVALQRITGFMHGLPAERYRADPVPEVTGDGVGARMLAAVLAYELLRDGEDRARAVELARFALDTDRLLAVDNGLLWIVAAVVLQLADEDLGDFWERARTQAHAAGELFAALSVNLWRGFTQWRHGQLDDAAPVLGRRDRAAADVGRLGRHRDVRRRVHARRAARPGRPGGRERAPGAARGSCPGSARVAGCCGRAPPGCSSSRAGPPRHSTSSMHSSTNRRSSTPPGRRGAAWRRVRSRRSERPTGPSRSRTRRWPSCARGAHPRRWVTPCGFVASCGAPTGRADLREAVEALSGSRAVLESARAQVSLGRSPGVDDAEAVPLLRSALETARWCGARAVVRDAVAALAQRGQPPADPGAAPARVTSRQRHVSELVNAGLDVNEVAQRLFLTPGAVRAALGSTAEEGR